MKTIMLVDDSNTVLAMLSRILSKAGFKVETASDAGEGLAKFKAGPPIDLLITDLYMPGINGIDFIKEVRALPAYASMPILFHTTEKQQNMRTEAKEAGATGWICKPATAAELIDTILVMLERKI